MWSRTWQNNWVRNKVTSHSIEPVGQALGVRPDERCRQITFEVDTAACRTVVRASHVARRGGDDDVKETGAVKSKIKHMKP